MLESFRQDRYHEDTLMVFDRRQLEQEAKLASALVERWGMVAAAPDGEDSAGRAKVRLMTPQELVARACETAALLTAEVERRGWILVTPSAAPQKEG